MYLCDEKKVPPYMERLKKELCIYTSKVRDPSNRMYKRICGLITDGFYDNKIGGHETIIQRSMSHILCASKMVVKCKVMFTCTL